jgi:tricorn protease
VAAIDGPKAVLIDETAGSGGDYFPWVFKKMGGTPDRSADLGRVGGILGFPVLMDGGTVTAPNLAIWTPDGGFTVENEGVAPDIAVAQTPKDVIAGRDPQLEKAIEWITAALAKNPPKVVKRPAFRDKTRAPLSTAYLSSATNPVLYNIKIDRAYPINLDSLPDSLRRSKLIVSRCG